MKRELPAARPYLTAILKHELAPGERVIWQASPSLAGRLRISPDDLLRGTMALAGAELAVLSVQGAQGLATFVAISLVSAGTALALSSWRFWRSTRRSLYVITDRRAFSIKAVGEVEIQSFAGDQIATVLRHEGRSGHGDLLFAKADAWEGTRPTIHSKAGFLGLADVKAAERILRTTLSPSPKPTELREPA